MITIIYFESMQMQLRFRHIKMQTFAIESDRSQRKIYNKNKIHYDVKMEIPILTQ